MPVQDQIVIPVGRLQLVFHWQGDRYGHRLELAPDGARASVAWRPFLESVEGSPDDAWPASPPLQECHVEPRPDGRTVALLVGRAGKSHWSLSVLCDPASSGLLFEVACRLAGEPPWLGSRYRTRGMAVAESESGGQDAGEALPRLLLEAKTTGQKWLLRSQPLDKQIDNRSGEIAIAVRAGADNGIRTVLWRYELRLRL
jgi:hypothetical protein